MRYFEKCVTSGSSLHLTVQKSRLWSYQKVIRLSSLIQSKLLEIIVDYIRGEQLRIAMTKKTVLCSKHVATMQTGQPYGMIENGVVVVDGTNIAWVGSQSQLPKSYADWPFADFGDRLITPALIDPHTHIIFGGHRAVEFEMRLNGATYAEIARAGGGILSTVNGTRAASERTLLAGALPRVDALMAEGTSCIEVKSGYGLDFETELRMLRTARRIEQERPVRIRTGFLGAHAIPPEYADRGDEYIDEACIPTLRAGPCRRSGGCGRWILRRYCV